MLRELKFVKGNSRFTPLCRPHEVSLLTLCGALGIALICSGCSTPSTDAPGATQGAQRAAGHKTKKSDGNRAASAAFTRAARAEADHSDPADEDIEAKWNGGNPVITEIDEPETENSIGLIRCVFAGPNRPRTKWWVDTTDMPNDPFLVGGSAKQFDVGPTWGTFSGWFEPHKTKE